MTEREPQPPNLLGVGRVDPAVPGQPWWRYRRAALPETEPWRAAAFVHDPTRDPPAPRDTEHAVADHVVTERAQPPSVEELLAGGLTSPPDVGSLTGARSVEQVVADSRSPLPFVVAGFGMLAILFVAARSGSTSLGSFVVPLAGMSFAVAASIWQGRLHPEEPWIAKWLIAAIAAKIVAAYLRYLTLVVGYDGRQQGGDANHYHAVAHDLVLLWQGKGPGPTPAISSFRETAFVYGFDARVQQVVGNDFLAGFFVFALIAAIGTYMWYRAAADVVPILDKRLFFLFMMFAPSIMFWPASIGKEALMQLGIGSISLGLARLMQHRLVAGLIMAAAGGWLVWVVRPHLLAIVALAGGFAYVMGRVRSSTGIKLSRPIGIAAICVLVAFTVTQGADSLGLQDFSANSIEQTLNDQTASTSQGNSKFNNGGNSLNPIHFPQRVVNVLLRPFPWEVETSFQLLASLESALLVALVVFRWKSVTGSFRHARTMPFILYAWVMIALYCAAYAAFANFGLLVRQRSLVFPAVLLILSIDPLLARRASARLEDAARLEAAREDAPHVLAVPGSGGR